MSAPQFLRDCPRFLFFTGKGGVGKTSVACATAVQLADQGRRVLLVSTDPASNVGQVLGVTIGNTVTAIDRVPGLSALEIDPEQAADAYRERILGPVRGLLPDKELASITEQLSGSCTTEIASFNEFTAPAGRPDLIAPVSTTSSSTPPPPGTPSGCCSSPGRGPTSSQAGKGDASCLGPLAGLDKQRPIYAAAVAALEDPARPGWSWSPAPRPPRWPRSTGPRRARPDRHPRQHVVINGVLPPEAGDERPRRWPCEPASTRTRRDAAGVAGLPRDVIASGRRTWSAWRPSARPAAQRPGRPTPDRTDRRTDAPVAGAAGDAWSTRSRGTGTAWSCAWARAGSARPPSPRPSRSRSPTRPPGAPDHHRPRRAPRRDAARRRRPASRVSRIDPAEATQDYRDQVMATKGKNLDEAGRATSPRTCSRRAPRRSRSSSSSPRPSTNHGASSSSSTPHPPGTPCCSWTPPAPTTATSCARWARCHGYRTPLMRLQDPGQTKILLVTLPSRHPSPKPASSNTTSNAPASTPGHGSSTTPSPPQTPPHRCSAASSATKPPSNAGSAP